MCGFLLLNSILLPYLVMLRSSIFFSLFSRSYRPSVLFSSSSLHSHISRAIKNLGPCPEEGDIGYFSMSLLGGLACLCQTRLEPYPVLMVDVRTREKRMTDKGNLPSSSQPPPAKKIYPWSLASGLNSNPATSVSLTPFSLSSGSTEDI